MYVIRFWLFPEIGCPSVWDPDNNGPTIWGLHRGSRFLETLRCVSLCEVGDLVAHHGVEGASFARGPSKHVRHLPEVPPRCKSKFSGYVHCM